ncbi:MAG: hypothetical protein CEO21_292, partial [Microgenomates group bacterium Gr01-1014_80]
KTGLLSSKWSVIQSPEIEKSLKEAASVSQSSIDGPIAYLENEWDLPVTGQLKAQNKKVLASLNATMVEVSGRGKTSLASTKIKTTISEIDKLNQLIGKSSDAGNKTLFGQLNHQKELLSALNSSYAEIGNFLAQINKQSLVSGETKNGDQKDSLKQLNALNRQVASINKLPKVEKTLLAEAKLSLNQKQLKNKALTLRGVINANKYLLAQGPTKPLSSLWLEEGSIVFKTLISNPSSLISQTVPVKYYLPKEVKKENITKVDEGLTIKYDAEKDQYFAGGEFTLAANESKTLQVVVDDSVFNISEEEISSIRKQAEELSKPLKNTSYFAQGTVLKTDIDASLDKILALKTDGVTPEAKIRGYRDAQIELKGVREKLEKLKELATTAGSAGNLFGFVGGAQAIAVWGLIIIMAAGFVFLTLYLRSIKNSGIGAHSVAGRYRGDPFPPEIDEFVPEVQVKEPEPDEKRPPHYYKIMAVILAVVSVTGLTTFAVFARMHSQNSSKPNEVTSVTQPPTEVLGENTKAGEKAEDLKGEEVGLYVPPEAVVSVFTQPKVDSEVLTTLEVSQTVLKLSREDGWVRIVVKVADKKIAGWVDKDFIEDQSQTLGSSGKVKSESASLKLVTITDTPTGFLRIREAPGGQEIGKVDPGAKFPVLDSKSGWLQIVLDDGSLGWVSAKYISYVDTASGSPSR